MKVAYLIDTDWIIDYLNDREPVASRLEELRGEGIGVSIISLAELYEGVYGSRSQEDSEMKLLGLLSGITILGIDDGICRIFGRERGELRKRGLLIGDLDLFIASTSLYYELPLCTNNRRHYERLESLNVISI